MLQWERIAKSIYGSHGCHVQTQGTYSNICSGLQVELVLAAIRSIAKAVQNSARWEGACRDAGTGRAEDWSCGRQDGEAVTQGQAVPKGNIMAASFYKAQVLQ